LSTPGAVKILDKRINGALYLWTRYDGQVEGPHGLGQFLKGFLPCIVDYWGDSIDAGAIANDLMGLSREKREGEELEVFLPENEDRWCWGDYNYLITIETKKFKRFEYLTIKLETDVEDEDDEDRYHRVVLFQWEEGDDEDCEVEII